MRRLTPHLCNLLSANQFFDRLTGRCPVPRGLLQKAGENINSLFPVFRAEHDAMPAHPIGCVTDEQP